MRIHSRRSKLRKNPEDHTDREVAHANRMDWKDRTTVTPYQMRLVLQDVYQLRDVGQARRDFRTWCPWVKGAATKKGHQWLPPMVKVAKMVERHLAGIPGQ